MSSPPSSPNLTYSSNARDPVASDILPFHLPSPPAPSSPLSSFPNTPCPSPKATNPTTAQFPLDVSAHQESPPEHALSSSPLSQPPPSPSLIDHPYPIMSLYRGRTFLRTPSPRRPGQPRTLYLAVNDAPVGTPSSRMSSLIDSSPIQGQGDAKFESMQRKVEKARLEAADLREQERQAAKAQKEIERQEAQRKAEEARDATVQNILDFMRSQNMTLGGFLVEVSNPRKWKIYRNPTFFNTKDRVGQVLDNWASSGNTRVLEELERWACKLLVRTVDREAAEATKSKILSTRTKTVNESFISNFHIPTLYAKLCALCPVTTTLLRAFSTTTRQKKKVTAASKVKKDKFLASALFTLLGARSQQNSYSRVVLGLYSYAIGAPRQAISVLSHLGLMTSYPTLIGQGDSSRDVPPDTQKDTIEPIASTNPTVNPSTPPTIIHTAGVGETSNDIHTPPRDPPEVAPNGDSDDEDWEDIDDEEEQAQEEQVEEDHADEGRKDGETAQSDSDESLWEKFPLPADFSFEAESSMTRNQQENIGSRRGREKESSVEEGNREQLGHTEARPQAPKRKPRLGILQKLSNACRLTIHALARKGLLSYVYDNINLVFKAAEQVLGRSDSQENGTCATAFELHNASQDDLKTSDLLQSFDQAPPLTIKDLELNAEEKIAMKRQLEHTVLRIIVNRGGDRFSRFKKKVDDCLPITANQILVHRTNIHPLPTMKIDESSTKGNAEVIDKIFTEAEPSYRFSRTWFGQFIKILWGDQLSVARFRSVIFTRVGHDSVFNSFLNCICAPGLFHYQISATGAILETHWGTPGTLLKNPGSLYFHNTILDRKPFVISSPPPYRTCRDLIFISLYARVLHCLELVSGYDNLDDYAECATFEELQQHAVNIVKRFTNVNQVAELRHARSQEKQNVNDTNEVAITKGDMVFENALLFMQDALTLREFSDAIKTGDSGRVFTSLKVLAFMYRGSGRTKYAHECLHTVHNLTHVWHQRLRSVVMGNWLLNPTGKPNAFVPVDMVQEHLIFFTKKVYKAHGSAASWEWLEMISPVIGILRELSARINHDLGSEQGLKHTSPDTWRDISTLMDSLRSHQVYNLIPGRTIPGKDAEVPNIVAQGLLSIPKPLAEYNTRFMKQQIRRRRIPLIGEPAVPKPPPIPPNEAPSVPEPPPLPEPPSILQPQSTPPHTVIDLTNISEEDSGEDVVDDEVDDEMDDEVDDDEDDKDDEEDDDDDEEDDEDDEEDAEGEEDVEGEEYEEYEVESSDGEGFPDSMEDELLDRETEEDYDWDMD